MKKIFLSLFVYISFLITLVTPVYAAATGTITASPNPCILGIGGAGATHCGTIITWSTSNASNVSVRAHRSGEADCTGVNPASVPTGTYTANWIDAQGYIFDLCSGSSKLHSVSVTVTGGSTTNKISAAPNPTTNSSTTITWNTGDGSAGQVYVSIDGASDIGPVWQNKTGTEVAPWINPGSSYEFKLYQGTSHQTVIARVTVTRQSTPPGLSTVSYKISETVEGLNLAPELPYTVDASGNLITSYTFQNPKIGANFVFVMFKDIAGKWGGCGTNQTQACSATIELISVPSIASCSVDTSKADRVTFEILPKAGVGNGFGAETGKVEMGDVNLQTLKLERWDDGRIIAVLSGQPTDQVFQIKITDKKGLSVEGSCSSLSQLSLGTKLFCRAPQTSVVNAVSLILAEGKDKGQIVRSTVSIDKKGLVQGMTNTKLVEGQGYKVSLEAPKSVRKVIEFNAGRGTTILSNVKLPVGDIFPLDGGDGKINSADASELLREWRIVGSGGDKPGDFNDDGLVNSFDWACMRFDFGASDDAEPTAGPISKPVQTSVAPSATAVPSASVSSI